jgi:hypothetical protein
MPSVVPTVDEIDNQWAACMARIEKFQIWPEYVIEDYPIGGVSRGRCKLGVQFGEYRGGKMGFRCVRQCTDKSGAWCRQYAERYQPHPIVVVTGNLGTRVAAWLRLDPALGPYIQNANFVKESLDCAAPLDRRPIRKRSSHWVTISGVTYEHVEEADPPELIEAWDRWWSHYCEIGNTLLGYLIQHLRNVREETRHEFEIVQRTAKPRLLRE